MLFLMLTVYNNWYIIILVLEGVASGFAVAVATNRVMPRHRLKMQDSYRMVRVYFFVKEYFFYGNVMGKPYN